MFALTQSNNRFRLEMQNAHPALHSLFGYIQPRLERVLAFDDLNAIAESAERIVDGDSAENRILRVLDANCTVSEEHIQRIPADGPLIVVANHPFGGVEGLLLASLLKRRRKDVKVMANAFLGQIAQLRDLFILVDPFGGPGAVKANLAGMKESVRWLRNGGVLAVFPAGEVSHYDDQLGQVSDPAWSSTVGRLVQLSGAPVLPVYFEGTNGPLFQTLGMIHPWLRTLRLPHEFVNKRGTHTVARIGNAVSPERIKGFKTAADVTSYLRIRTYLQRTETLPTTSTDIAQSALPVVPVTETSAIRKDIMDLPEEALLVSHEAYRVYAADAPALPSVLREIGRLRELTFRANSEGTGKDIDLDQFDEHYLHLFLWNDETSEIVAAYRLGQTDVILPQQGKSGLYTRSLFNIRKRLLKQISPALEMGRSFVRIEYQRQFLPLLLLWRGIGTYVVRNPRYRNLFGPVSINSNYSNSSLQLLMDFLSNNNPDRRSRWVRAKTPPTQQFSQGFDPKTMSTVVRDFSELSSLISDIEEDKKELPVLLKQYLKLGGVLLGFNLDADFSDVVDGLILVDLVKTERHLLERYMGKEGANSFLSHWR
ncbi:MAG: lysophospholipid acyltransferase family protein [Bacteroidota bacterium]